MVTIYQDNIFMLYYSMYIVIFDHVIGDPPIPELIQLFRVFKRREILEIDTCRDAF